MLRVAPEIYLRAYSGLIFTCNASIIKGNICPNGCTVHYITISCFQSHVNLLPTSSMAKINIGPN